MNDIFTLISIAGFLLWLSRNAFSGISEDIAKTNLLKRIKSDYPFIQDVANKTNVPFNIVLAVIAVESSGNQYASGSAGEIGLMQITFGAVEQVNRVFKRNYSIFDLNTPISNVQIGCLYLRYLRNQTSSWKNAIQAYNAGLGGYKTGVSLGYYRKVQNYINQYKFI